MVENPTRTEERKLAAIMFTDIVGYTALAQSDESLSLEMLERHNKLLRPFFTRFYGRVVKTIGDSYLVEFDSALEATKCAIEIQAYLHDYNISSKDYWKIKLRIGIHLGDVVHRDDDIFGDAVNIASRIEPLARPEGICISEQVFDQVHNKLNYSLWPLEKSELKNIKDMIEVYEIELPWEITRSHERSQKLDARRIAVLPFSSLSPHVEDEYFADGMTDEVISTISKIQGLEVISRTSVMQYKKAPKAVKEVSRELEVGTILEGSIRKSGNKLRVTTQMIDAERDRHLWAESYDRELQDIFVIQRDIATKVAEVLEARFSRTGGEAQSTDNIEAYTIYLKAMHKFHESTRSSLMESITLFEKAISLDQRFARAFVGLAYVWGRMAQSGNEDFPIAARRSEIAAKKAIELSPESGESHAALANAYMYSDNYSGSEAEAKKAIELNPNLSEAHISLGVNLSSLLGVEYGLAELQKGYDLDPLSLIAASFLSYALMALGRSSEALEMLQKLDRVNPGNRAVYSIMIDCYMEMNNFDEARRLLEQYLSIDSNEPNSRIQMAMLLAYTGKRKEAEAILNEMKNTATESSVLWGEFYVQNAFGNFDGAFKALMRMAELHAWPYQIKSMPELKDLRKDPRFSEFCKKVGLPIT